MLQGSINPPLNCPETAAAVPFRGRRPSHDPPVEQRRASGVRGWRSSGHQHRLV